MIKNLFFGVAILFSSIAMAQTHATMNVNVIGPDDKGKPGETISFIDPAKEKPYTMVTDENGKFSLQLPKGVNYKVQYYSAGKETDYTNIEIPDQPGEMNFNFELKYEAPTNYIMTGVQFKTGSHELLPTSSGALDKLVNEMKNKKTMKIEIGGHTDNVGDSKSNQQLSERRAKSVKDYLVTKGIDMVRLESKGYGETKPIASNETDQGRQQNRRTEVTIISKG
jgi:OOP family OmpA-OmpF porin